VDGHVHLRQADKLIGYFERLVAAGEDGWRLQLLIASLWKSALESDLPIDRQEFLSLARRCGTGQDLGTAYEELTFAISRWASDTQ